MSNLKRPSVPLVTMSQSPCVVHAVNGCSSYITSHHHAVQITFSDNITFEVSPPKISSCGCMLHEFRRPLLTDLQTSISQSIVLHAGIFLANADSLTVIVFSSVFVQHQQRMQAFAAARQANSSYGAQYAHYQQLATMPSVSLSSSYSSSASGNPTVNNIMPLPLPLPPFSTSSSTHHKPMTAFGQMFEHLDRKSVV